MQFLQRIIPKCQPNALVVLLAFAPLATSCIVSAEQPLRPAYEPTLIDDWISKLGDDQPRVRSDASHQILGWAQHGNSRQREDLLQSLLRAGLTAELELQMAINRLIEEVREHEFERTLAGFIDQTEFSNERLAMSWQTFSKRASSGSDSRHVFAKLAASAGPSLDWETIETRRRQDPETTVLVSHLGCVAPVQPMFFQPESEVVYAQLIANRQRARPIPVATKEARVLDRLLDATIVNNPYGWTVHQRLRLALLYRRHAVAMEVGDLVMGASDRLPVDWTAAMMAFRQVERYSGWIDTTVSTRDSIRWSDRIEAIVDSLEDARTLAVRPTTRWVPAVRKVVRKLPPRQNRQMLGIQAEIVRTRVQDIAAWILLDRNNLDARSHGMPQLQADSIWGVHQASVGFTSEHERKLVIAKVKR